MKKLIYRMITLIIFIIMLIFIFILLRLFNTNLIIALLTVMFLFLLGLGPIISGFNKERLKHLFHRPNLGSTSLKKERKLITQKKIIEPQIKRPSRVSLDFEYNRGLIIKCKKCGMTLISSAKTCPNCGTKTID